MLQLLGVIGLGLLAWVIWALASRGLVMTLVRVVRRAVRPRRPKPRCQRPATLARTLDPATTPGFEPWRDVPDDYNPLGPDKQGGRAYETFNRAERVRDLVTTLRMHMRWSGDDGDDELDSFDDEKLALMRKRYPDVDALMPTILTSLAHMWQTQPAVFVALVNEAMHTDYEVDPTVALNCYRRGLLISAEDLRDHWMRTIRDPYAAPAFRVVKERPPRR
jgi:hypothetical protein